MNGTRKTYCFNQFPIMIELLKEKSKNFLFVVLVLVLIPLREREIVLSQKRSLPKMKKNGAIYRKTKNFFNLIYFDVREKDRRNSRRKKKQTKKM